MVSVAVITIVADAFECLIHFGAGRMRVAIVHISARHWGAVVTVPLEARVAVAVRRGTGLHALGVVVAIVQ